MISEKLFKNIRFICEVDLYIDYEYYYELFKYSIHLLTPVKSMADIPVGCASGYGYRRHLYTPTQEVYSAPDHTGEYTEPEKTGHYKLLITKLQSIGYALVKVEDGWCRLGSLGNSFTAVGSSDPRRTLGPSYS